MTKRGVSYLSRLCNLVLVAIISVSLGLVQVSATEMDENGVVVKERMNDNKAGDETGKPGINNDNRAPEPPELPSFDTDVAPEKKPSEDTTNTTLITIGAVVAGAAVLGIALGGGGGGGSTAPAPDPTPTPTKPPPEKFAGPDIAGQWSGTLDLVKFPPEPVSATITQDRENITIKTTSTRPYGRNFTGTITEKGAILVYDQETSEDWTTSEGSATDKVIRLFDWTSTTGQLDKLELHR